MRQLIAVLCFVFAGSAHAGLITDTYESQVNGVLGRGFTDVSVGDKFNWSVTYDPNSVVMIDWLDGANGTAEQGGGDDTVAEKLCIGGTAVAADCSAGTFSDYSDVRFRPRPCENPDAEALHI
jgi:hypothetical protein